ncbi:ATP-binding cassette domain-containing protein [Ramlibacter algicola]|uniref:ABC transporter ATP-binding protein n=1 Tax=Ramlibacter algicola TaxID=2795217 RepID=A0A934PY92_9BURK|nr:ABC transporter ATP-binding protein [Ramlibacter algicola]MBK0391277.1 ABC transporter ATP-binding protein [Ramlibacter algicola]
MIDNHLRLWAHLAPLHRAGAVVLTIGNVVASVLEVIALALFGALLLHLTQGAPATAPLPGLGTLGGAGLRTITVACGAIYLAKNLLMVFLAWLEARLAFGVQVHLSVKTLASLMGQDYEDASRVDESTKINLLVGGMSYFAFNVLLPGLTLLAEATVMVALVLFLVLTQPLFVSGMLATLCAVAGILVAVSRRVVLRLGVDRHGFEDQRLKLLSGIFGHLREMYVYAATPRAVVHLQALLTRLAATYRGFQMLQASPRFVLELALIGVLLLVVYRQSGGTVAPALVVSMGVFGVAGFRLLLGINRLVGCVQAMRFAGPTIEKILRALSTPAVHGAHAAAAVHRSHPGPAVLKLAGVSYAYEPGKPVLQGLDLELRRGTIVGIKGRSGAGKSTLLDIVAGLRTPGSGWIELDGQRIAHKQELVGRVAYAGQQPAVFPDTVRANVAFGRPPETVDDGAVWRALAAAHLDHVVRALPHGLDHRLGFGQSLSGGQVQRLALARALYMDCHFLLLDEPTAALDPETERELLATLREVASTTAVVLVSHRPAPLEAADVVLDLRDGRLVDARGEAA